MQEDKKTALGMGLQQIIQTDHQANLIIEQARQQGADIAKKAEQEKQEILRQAEDERQKLDEKARREEEEALQKRIEAARLDFAQQGARLEQAVAEHGDEWARDMARRITGQ